MLPKIAIVGRANAGKSTLFNRLSRSRKAIVEDRPGVTRDRIIADASYAGYSFTLIDTGGFETTDNPELPPREVTYQIEKAIEDARAILFLVDGREPVTSYDSSLAQLLRKSRKPFVVAVNKIDGPRHEAGLYDYYELGAEKTLAISALHGEGVAEMLEALFSYIPEVEQWKEEGDDSEEEESEDEEREAAPEIIPIAVIGKPNVGKSTFVNAILGFERSIVSDMPGTTRDIVDTPFSYKERELLLVDTAGIRRPSKVKEPVEYYSVQRALKAVDKAKVTVFLLDATDEVSQQDKRIAGYAERQGRAAVIGVNKWDLVSDKTSIKKYEDEVHFRFKFLSYAPVVTISAKAGQRIFTLLEKAIEVADASTRRVPTSLFNRFLEKIQLDRPPPIYKNKRVKFYFGAQKGVSPPRFEIVSNYPEGVHFSYQRFLVNSIREAFDFTGNPIKISFIKREQTKKA